MEEFELNQKQQKMYETYVKYYQKAEARIGVLYSEQLTPNQFIRLYDAKKDQYREQIEKGLRKKMPNVTRDLVSRQEYFLSHAEIRNWARAAREQGMKQFTKSTLQNVQSREELKPLSAAISARYAELRHKRHLIKDPDTGETIERFYTREEAQIIIAHEYFGS